MRCLSTTILVIALVIVPFSVACQSTEVYGTEPIQEEEMEAALTETTNVTQPGPHHKILERFLGKWTTTTKYTMAGMEGIPEAKGSAEFSWLMDGRWLQSIGDMQMMGMRAKTAMWLGYDNFKKSYVCTMLSGFDTMMLRAEGDLDKSGEVLRLYGTMDEYLTGEHDKIVRYDYSFLKDGTILLGVHDLHMGIENSQVFEVRFTRVK